MRQFIFTFFLCVVFGAVWGQGDETFNEFQRNDMPAVMTNSNCQSAVVNNATIDLVKGEIDVTAALFAKKAWAIQANLKGVNTNTPISLLKEGNVKPEGKAEFTIKYGMKRFDGDKGTGHLWIQAKGGVGTGQYTVFDVQNKAFTDTSGFTHKEELGLYYGFKVGEEKYYCAGLSATYEGTNNIQDLPVMTATSTSTNNNTEVTETKYARKGTFNTYNQLSFRGDFLAYLGGDANAKYALNLYAIGSKRYVENSVITLTPGIAFFMPIKNTDEEAKNKIVHIGIRFQVNDVLNSMVNVGKRTQLDLVVGIPIFRNE